VTQISKLATSLLWLLVLFVTSCGYRPAYRSRSPNQRHEVVFLEEQFFADSKMKIVLRTGFSENTLYEDNMDWILGFAAVSWSDDSTRVGVFACNPYGHDVLFGYDLIKKTAIGKDIVEDSIRQSIRKRYKLANHSVDPVRWACTNAGAGAFVMAR
jgi:hypothetical protein